MVREIEYILIETKDDLAELVWCLKNAKEIAADNESNGLNYYCEHSIIGSSFFFPQYMKAFYIAYRHGEGQVEVRYNESHPATMEFAKMSWQGNTKPDLYLRYWWNKFYNEVKANPLGMGDAGFEGNYWGNVPVEWIDEIKAVWGLPDKTYIFHNARFDLHMMEADGYPSISPKALVEDTMLGLHLEHEDWRGLEIEAPYKWSQKTAPKDRKDLVGMWARDEQGRLLLRKGAGNRELKWQATCRGFTNSTKGEGELRAAKDEFGLRLAEYVMAHFDDPMNKGLTFKDGLGKDREKQLARFKSKLAINEKSQMWMLPAYDVALYAMLDTVLTWYLREDIMPKLKAWDNVELYYNVCAIQQNVAWRMEKNGLLLDLKAAREMIAEYQPRAKELQGKVDDIADTLGIHRFSIGSNKKLLQFLKVALRYHFEDLDEVIPSWISPQKRAELVNVGYTAEALEGLKKVNKAQLAPFVKHPIVMLVFEYRKVHKIVNTYLNNWVKSRDPHNVVRMAFDISGTVAGRASSSGRMGNGQNIPSRGYTIKRSLIAREGRLMWGVDYGQLEARIAAWIGELLLPEMGAYEIEEATMVRLFNEGEDMHSYVRDLINIRQVVYRDASDQQILIAKGYALDDIKEFPRGEADWGGKVADLCRQIAKTLNFGLLYSGSWRMVSRLLGTDEDASKVLETSWRKIFPAFALAQKYYTRTALTPRKRPDGQYGMYVTQPITGRHRKIGAYPTFKRFKNSNGIWDTFNPQEANARKTWNNTVQGLGGWMSMNACLEFGNNEGWDGIYPFAQIHDAIDGEAEYGSLNQVKKLMGYMINYPTNPVLTTDLEAGTNWQDLKKVKNIDLWVSSNGHLGYAKGEFDSNYQWAAYE